MTFGFKIEGGLVYTATGRIYARAGARTWDSKLKCYVRRTAPCPVDPDSRRPPLIDGGGTPKELAARALIEGDVELAAEYWEMAVS